MFKRIFQTTESLFTYTKDDNGYYIVNLKKSLLAVTVKEEHAKSLINKIEPLYNWSKVKDIQTLFEKDRKSYEKVAEHLRRYGVERKYNGNYRESYDDGQVEYKLEGKYGLVQGMEHCNGIGVRETEDYYEVDAIYAGKTLAKFGKYGDVNSKVEEFVTELAKHFILTNGEKINRLLESTDLRRYIDDLGASIQGGFGPFPPPEDEMLQIQFELYGGQDPEKEEVFLSSFKKLNQLVGLEAVKEQMEAFMKSVAVDRKLEAYNRKAMNKTRLHSIFYGNAGTGKTVVGRLFADLLWSIDLIEERKLIEVSKEDLVRMYVGETETNVSKVIEESLGGVLFVDEAYMLADNKGNDNNGKTALEIIMRAMDNNDNMVVIFAGYEKEINELLDTNQGLRSRFDYKFLFEDFNEEELVQVAIGMIQERGFHPIDIDEAVLKVIKKNSVKGTMQGNARSVRKIVDRIIEKQKIAISNGVGHYTNVTPDIVLSLIDDESKNEKNMDKKKQSEDKLMSLIGLEGLKSEIRNWSNYVKIEKMRFDRGMSNEKATFHMTFEGNPGTGKTTVARIVGEMLKYNGLLSKGHFREVSRADLVAEYMGQTAVRVKKVIEESLGGILFIDEAYSLYQGENDTFGKEAVDTLMDLMEKYKDDLVVILAGYTDKIDVLIKSNPGFTSRIANRFVFPDYSADELYELFLLNMSNYGFIISADAQNFVEGYIRDKKSNNEVDGNGRWVRNLVDRIKMSQANRLVEENSDDLESIVLEDVQELAV